LSTDPAYEPWDGYDDEQDEEALIRRLELKVDESRERYDRAYAQAVCAAVASHEQLKQQRSDDRYAGAALRRSGTRSRTGSAHGHRSMSSAGPGRPRGSRPADPAQPAAPPQQAFFGPALPAGWQSFCD